MGSAKRRAARRLQYMVTVVRWDQISGARVVIAGARVLIAGGMP